MGAYSPKKMEHKLGSHFGDANIPDDAEAWEFATYPLDGDQVAKEEAWVFANKSRLHDRELVTIARIEKARDYRISGNGEE